MYYRRISIFTGLALFLLVSHLDATHSLVRTQKAKKICALLLSAALCTSPNAGCIGTSTKSGSPLPFTVEGIPILRERIVKAIPDNPKHWKVVRELQAEELEGWILEQYLTSWKETVQKYPPGLVQRLVKKIEVWAVEMTPEEHFSYLGAPPIGGHADRGTIGIYVTALRQENGELLILPSSRNLAAKLMMNDHEIAHLVFGEIVTPQFKAKWNSLNPRNFSYGKASWDMSGTNFKDAFGFLEVQKVFDYEEQFPGFYRHLQHGFVSDYAGSRLEEDFAETAALVMRPDFVKTIYPWLMKHAPLVAKKAELVMQAYESFDARFDFSSEKQDRKD